MMTIAVVGGTGREGSGLAVRWAKSGYRVIIGSRDAQKAQQKVDELNTAIGSGVLHGADNLSAAKQADLVVLTVPYSAHHATLEPLREALQGKILVDVTVPVQPPNIRVVYLPDGKSASLEAQAFLGSNVKVVTAFQHVSFTHLKESEGQAAIACDVLICGDDDKAKEDVIQLAQAAGMRGLDAGPLVNSIAVEAFGPVLMHLNKRYKIKESGITITGLDAS